MASLHTDHTTISLGVELPLLGRATGLALELTHKRAIEEVFFTELSMCDGEDGPELVATAQLPRSHALYSELANGFHDLLLMVEIGRQGMEMYGHGILDVPGGTAFVMTTNETEATDLEATRKRDEPSTIVIRVPFAKERRSAKGRVRGYALSAIGEIDGIPAIAFSGEALLIPSALYDRARGAAVVGVPEDGSAPVAVAPSRVGRLAPRNVVVGDVVSSEHELQCAIVTDPTHPSFFDHPLDHVPAMLTLEVARQAAVLYVGARGWLPQETVVDRCSAHFTQYTALWPPGLCRIVALEPAPGVAESSRPGAAAAEAESSSAGAEAGPAEAAPSHAEEVLAQSVRAHFEQNGQDNGYVDLRLRRVGA